MYWEGYTVYFFPVLSIEKAVLFTASVLRIQNIVLRERSVFCTYLLHYLFKKVVLCTAPLYCICFEKAAVCMAPSNFALKRLYYINTFSTMCREGCLCVFLWYFIAVRLYYVLPFSHWVSLSSFFTPPPACLLPYFINYFSPCTSRFVVINY